MKSKPISVCPYCNKQFVKLHAHIRHCKQKTDPVLTDPVYDDLIDDVIIDDASEGFLTSQKRRISSFFRPSVSIECFTLEDKLTAKSAIAGLHPEDKYKRFFTEPHLWSIEPPKLSLLDRFKNIFVKSDVEFKKCVFVSEDADPKFGYYPYDPKNKYLFLPDGRIYDVPQSGDIWFFNANRFLPLIHSRDPGDLYDLPIHHVTAIHNDGVQYGQSMGFTDLIDSIKSISIISKICAAVAVVCVVGSVIIVREIMKDYASLAADVQTLKLLLTGGV